MAELHTVELDGYDLDVFARILRTEKSLQAHLERLSRLLPHPEALLADLFATLFKLNVMVRPQQELSPAVLINRRLVEAVLGREGIKTLRARTQLNEAETRDALVLLTDRVLRALTRKGRTSPGALVDGMEVASTEEALEKTEQMIEHLDNWEGLDLDETTRKQLKKDLNREKADQKTQLKKAREKQSAHADELPLDLDNEIGASVERMSDEMTELESNLRGLGLGSGLDGGGSRDARRRLELGERLAQSKKLRLLARLAGAFKELAFDVRKKTIPRAPQTVHSIGLGADLTRLLPSELLGLNKARRGVHLDFLRRFVDGRLMQYELHAPANRGPMVICVDGSGSMTGSKEIWAKAVGLTLMEIARREKRRCLAMVFSDGPQVFEVELLSKRSPNGQRSRAEESAVFAFAEHFPGGGTDFESPLRRAVEAVSEGHYRHGDIIFITDGQADISSGLEDYIRNARKPHRFKIRGLLVGTEDQQAGQLAKVADELVNVHDLTGDILSDLFTAV